MVKNVKIGKQSYDMKASVLTLETYKRLYDKDLMGVVADLKNEFNDAINKGEWITKIQSIMLDVLKIAHVMIQEFNPNFMSYEDWVKDLDGLLDEPKWIAEVLEVAMSPFRTGSFEK